MATVVNDPFTDTDGTALTAHTPPTAPASWVNEAGSRTIQSNKAAYASDDGVALSLTSIDAGVADCTVSGDILAGDTVGTYGFNASLVFNVTDKNNHWGVLLRSGAWDLYKRIAGAFTTTNTGSASVNAGETHNVQPQTIGDRVIVALDTVQVLDTTIGSRPLKTATKVGIAQGLAADWGTSLHDNIVVTTADTALRIPPVLVSQAVMRASVY